MNIYRSHDGERGLLLGSYFINSLRFVLLFSFDTFQKGSLKYQIPYDEFLREWGDTHNIYPIESFVSQFIDYLEIVDQLKVKLYFGNLALGHSCKIVSDLLPSNSSYKSILEHKIQQYLSEPRLSILTCSGHPAKN